MMQPSPQVTKTGIPTDQNSLVHKSLFVLPNLRYQRFLNELQSYACGYWKSLQKPRIREVFVVEDLTHPLIGRIDKVYIKRKAASFITLLDSREFDIYTGRSLSAEPEYIFPVEDRRVWNEWEQQSLRRRIGEALPKLPFKAVRDYADLLHPNWNHGIFTKKLDRTFGRKFNRPAESLSEQDEACMAWCRQFAKEAILSRLPSAIRELRALVETMERTLNDSQALTTLPSR